MRMNFNLNYHEEMIEFATFKNSVAGVRKLGFVFEAIKSFMFFPINFLSKPPTIAERVASLGNHISLCEMSLI